MLIGFYIVLAVLGSLLAMSVVRIVDWAIKVFDPTHRKRSLAEQALVSTGCNVFWISGYSLKAALLWAGCTAVLWPVFVGVYLLVRYRPHWFTIWSAFKAVFAVAISPFILLVFQLDKWAFINIMTALWPHIDIYTPDGKLYLRRWFMTPKGQSYRPRFLHLIMLSDVGRDPHDHPPSTSAGSNSSSKTEPRPPFQAVQRIGHAVPRGFVAYEVNVLDWDDEWWMWTWEWRKLNVRRNLLLQPSEGSDRVSELAETKGDTP